MARKPASAKSKTESILVSAAAAAKDIVKTTEIVTGVISCVEDAVATFNRGIADGLGSSQGVPSDVANSIKVHALWGADNLNLCSSPIDGETLIRELQIEEGTQVRFGVLEIGTTSGADNPREINRLPLVLNVGMNGVELHVLRRLEEGEIEEFASTFVPVTSKDGRVVNLARGKTNYLFSSLLRNHFGPMITEAIVQNTLAKINPPSRDPGAPVCATRPKGPKPAQG